MAKPIMIQGTMSNVGKSLLTAGLCRVFRQDGYKVAPFKSQNMALNSYITEDGLEMGRAQVVQAEAAKISPRIEMNPILLKPTNDTGSQVIVNGESIGTMPAKEYFAYKKKLIPQIQKAYETLDREYDIIVIEGAGSPAEINLKSDDIVNMGMAKMAKAPVLLVGDIDRGGVFAQMLGTVMLLEEDERKRIKGCIINKFRGDRMILEPGLAMLEEKIGIPVSGVIPFVPLDIEDEDSLSERIHTTSGKPGEMFLIDIAVIRLPRISNFTDFNVFSKIQGVSLRYVDRASKLGYPDMILIPGTKNTIEDCLWMRQNGLEALVLKQANQGVLVFGICGGYQILGETLSDPDGVEISGGTSIAGFGLLPVETVFEQNKTKTLVKGTFQDIEGVLKPLSGISFEGYEIHMGKTTGKAERNVTTFQRNQDENPHKNYDDGSYRGNVYGTYIHGIFDQDEVAAKVVTCLMMQKGLDETAEPFDYKQYKEQQYDKLAKVIRENLDMEHIYRILEEGESCENKFFTRSI